MFQNMNMMNNIMQTQNLLNMNMKLMNIQSQFNGLLTQIQNNGITPNIDILISNISFQFINFGIELLNLRGDNNNIICNNIIKEQINNSISELNKISLNINCNNMNPQFNIVNNSFNNHKYNVVIKEDNGNSKVFVCEDNTTVEELIKRYLIEIGRIDLINRDEEEFLFRGYRGNLDIRINTSEKKSKTISEISNGSDNIVILCSKYKNMI